MKKFILNLLSILLTISLVNNCLIADAEIKSKEDKQSIVIEQI